MGFVTGTTAECCNIVQTAIQDLVGRRDPSTIMPAIGGLYAATSPQNNQGLEPLQYRTNGGKDITLEVPYWAIDCDEATAEDIDLCGEAEPDAETMEPSYLKFDSGFTTYSQKGKIDKVALRDKCTDTAEQTAQQLMRAGKRILKSVNTAFLTQAIATVGNYPISGDDSGALTATIPMINESGDLNKAAFTTIGQQFGLMKVDEAPIMVSGLTMDSAQRINGLDNQSGGLPYEPGLMFGGINNFYDLELDTILDNTYAESFALAWAPGAIRLGQVWDNTGAYQELSDPRVTKTTIELFGFLFDYYVKYDPDCSTYFWILKLKFQTVFLPNSVYSDCYDWNQRLLFKVGCGTWACQDLKI